MSYQASSTIPQLDLSNLQRAPENDISQTAILGYSVQSWVNAYQTCGPVIQDKDSGQIYACGSECNELIWRAKDIWGYRDTSSGDIFITQLGDGYVTASDGEYHREQRRILRPSLTGKAVSQHSQDVADILQQGFASYTDQEIDLHDKLIFLYTKALNSSMVKTGATDQWIHRFAQFEEEFIRGAAIQGKTRAAWYARDNYQQLRTQVLGYFDDLVEQRLAGENRDDGLDILIQSMARLRAQDLQSDPAAIKRELVRDAYMMQAGGAGNIATLFCNLLWALNQHPQWHNKLRKELEQADLKAVATTGVKHLPITRAIILEVERLFVPTTSTAKLALEDTELLGYKIPQGTEIFHLFALHNYLPENYKNPLIFDPSRWFDNHLKRAVSFGGGAHICAGMHVASLFILLSLITFVPAIKISCKHPPKSKKIDINDPSSPTRTSFMVRLNSSDKAE